MDISYEQAKLVLSAIDDAINLQHCRVLTSYDSEFKRQQDARNQAEKYLRLRHELGKRLQAVEDEAKKVLDEMLERDKE